MTTPTTPRRAGLRLASQVCATEIIVVRPGSAGELACGGAAMVERGAATFGATGDPALMNGSALGKRYTDPDDDGLEVLVTAGGAGSLTIDGRELVVKQAKPLPASD